MENVNNIAYFVGETSIISYNLQTYKKEESREAANSIILALAGFPTEEYIKLVVRQDAILLSNRANQNIELSRQPAHPTGGHINVVDYFDPTSQEHLTLVVCSVQVAADLPQIETSFAIYVVDFANDRILTTFRLDAEEQATQYEFYYERLFCDASGAAYLICQEIFKQNEKHHLVREIQLSQLEAPGQIGFAYVADKFSDLFDFNTICFAEEVYEAYGVDCSQPPFSQEDLTTRFRIPLIQQIIERRGAGAIETGIFKKTGTQALIRQRLLDIRLQVQRAEKERLLQFTERPADPAVEAYRSREPPELRREEKRTAGRPRPHLGLLHRPGSRRPT